MDIFSIAEFCYFELVCVTQAAVCEAEEELWLPRNECGHVELCKGDCVDITD